MNTLQEQIEKDFKEALKNGEKDRLGLIRSLKAAFGNASLKKGNMTEPLTLEEAQNVIRKQIEQREDSIRQFLKGQREDLAEKEKAEADILEKYLPVEIDDDTLHGIIYKVLGEYENPTRKNTGEIIGKVFAAAGGNANRKRIAAIVNTHLQ